MHLYVYINIFQTISYNRLPHRAKHFHCCLLFWGEKKSYTRHRACKVSFPEPPWIKLAQNSLSLPSLQNSAINRPATPPPICMFVHMFHVGTRNSHTVPPISKGGRHDVRSVLLEYVLSLDLPDTITKISPSCIQNKLPR